MKVNFTKGKLFVELFLDYWYVMIKTLSDFAIFLLVYHRIIIAILFWIFFLLFFLTAASVDQVTS